MAALRTSSRAVEARVDDLRVRTATVPTDRPESDGTLAWDATTIVVVEARSGDTTGLGYTYAHEAAGVLIHAKLRDVVAGTCAMDVPATWLAMEREVRNLGQQGLGAMAISAVDVALWDLKARLLDVPLASLVGRFHDAVPVYGSGGFCSYTDEELAGQL